MEYDGITPAEQARPELRGVMKRFGLPFVLLALLASPAAAQPADPQGELARSLDALGRQGGREAVQQIEARVAQGLPPPLLARAVAALARIGDRYAVSALLSLASHRRAVVRAQVAEALGRSRDARARPVLGDLLDDPDARVRSSAAVALGLLGPESVIDSLVIATARGVSEAAIVVGQHARPADVPRLLGRVDASTLPAFAPALRVLLERDNLPLRSKQAIVRALAALRGGESEHILREIGATLGPNDPLRPTVNEALEQLASAEAAQ